MKQMTDLIPGLEPKSEEIERAKYEVVFNRRLLTDARIALRQVAGKTRINATVYESEFRRLSNARKTQQVAKEMNILNHWAVVDHFRKRLTLANARVRNLMAIAADRPSDRVPIAKVMKKRKKK